jgi:hypothetical protein
MTWVLFLERQPTPLERVIFKRDSRTRDSARARVVMTRFRARYDNGDIPARVAHCGVNGIAWRVDPGALDARAYLPLFISGISETQHPYRLLAVRGAEDLIKSCGERAMLEALPRLILPMKEALNTGDARVLAVAFDLLYTMTTTYAAVGEALVPYHRQLLPVFRAYKDVDTIFVSLVNLCDAKCWSETRPKSKPKTTRDGAAEARLSRGAPCTTNLELTAPPSPPPRNDEAIGYGRSKRTIGSLVRRTLRALERSGGPDALASIQYMVPSYASAVPRIDAQ